MSKNNEAWKKLFETHSILRDIEVNGFSTITAGQICKVREPRLMVKFDNSEQLPDIFKTNHLSILPITRGSYVLSQFENYHKLPEHDCKMRVKQMPLPDNIQSIDPTNITSETIAINSAYVSGIFADFIGEEQLYPTVSGRMGSGDFKFHISRRGGGSLIPVEVSKSQIEIDAAFEGNLTLSLIEAKINLTDNFLIRQLYYPFRVWSEKVTKIVKPLFVIYTNGIFRLLEYNFQEPQNYNSLVLTKEQTYSLDNMDITQADIDYVRKNTLFVPKPVDIPFPQADKFERVINICELLLAQPMTHDEFTVEFGFTERQTQYYADAAIYLGLVCRVRTPDGTQYSLTEMGSGIMKLSFKKRQLAFCKLILSHPVFNDVYQIHCHDKTDIVKIMKKYSLGITSEETYLRRASTISGWVFWIEQLTV